MRRCSAAIRAAAVSPAAARAGHRLRLLLLLLLLLLLVLRWLAARVPGQPRRTQVAQVLAHGGPPAGWVEVGTQVQAQAQKQV